MGSDKSHDDVNNKRIKLTNCRHVMATESIFGSTLIAVRTLIIVDIRFLLMKRMKLVDNDGEEKAN